MNALNVRLFLLTIQLLAMFNCVISRVIFHSAVGIIMSLLFVHTVCNGLAERMEKCYWLRHGCVLEDVRVMCVVTS